MLKKLRRGGAIAAALALAISGLGFTTPALAEGEEQVATYSPGDAKLTKVIVASNGTDASADEYVFQFLGKGTIKDGDSTNGQSPDAIYSADGVQQDGLTLSVGEEMPQIPDVKLKGRTVSADNSLHTEQTYQTVVSENLSEILKDVVFPHAGVYTYLVTEKSANTNLTDGTVVNSSKAAYTLRVRVVNDTTSDDAIAAKKVVVKDVTVDKVRNDEGATLSSPNKVDPSYPLSDDSGKITYLSSGVQPTDGKIAGLDERGRDVSGFTFTNEYMKGGSLVVKKLVKGEFADKTKKFHIVLELTDEIATTEEAKGCVATYIVSGGDDVTKSNLQPAGGHTTLNGIYEDSVHASQSMVEFDSVTGTAKIEADLYEGGTITITGVFGPYSDAYPQIAPNGKNNRMIVSPTGPKVDTVIKVTESDYGNYTPTGYVNYNDDDADPRTEGFTKPETWSGEFTANSEEDLVINGSVATKSTIVYVVNTLEDSKVTPTGIFIDNLPYILMVGVPVAVFAAMFVIRRRTNAAA